MEQKKRLGSQSTIAEHHRRITRFLVLVTFSCNPTTSSWTHTVAPLHLTLVRLKEMIEHGTTKEHILGQEYDSRPKVINNVYPTRWSYNTIIRAIEVLDNAPDKLASTHLTREHEWGKTREETEEEFMQLIERARREEQGE